MTFYADQSLLRLFQSQVVQLRLQHSVKWKGLYNCALFENWISAKANKIHSILEFFDSMSISYEAFKKRMAEIETSKIGITHIQSTVQ